MLSLLPESAHFFRVAYKFKDSILDEFLHDPDEESAIQSGFAGEIMCPWKLRLGVDPPYWVANLDCMRKPAPEGVPHIRCMGLRLQASDPVDAPPAYMPPGYRYFGQAFVEALEKIREKAIKAFEEDVLLMPRQKVVKFSACQFEKKHDEITQNTPNKVLEVPFVNFLFPLDLKFGVALWVPIGHISDYHPTILKLGDEDGIFGVMPAEPKCDHHFERMSCPHDHEPR